MKCSEQTKAYLHEVRDQTVVKVFTTQVSVSSCGLDLEDTRVDGQQADIKSTATQVKDEHGALAL